MGFSCFSKCDSFRLKVKAGQHLCNLNLVKATDRESDIPAMIASGAGDGEEIRKLPDSHRYHDHCIKKKSETHLLCLLCRQSPTRLDMPTCDNL